MLNVLGLALGIACAVVLFRIISFETSFDNYHKNGDRVARVVSHFFYAGSDRKAPNVPTPIAEALRTDFPQLEAVSMVNYSVGGNQQITLIDQAGNPQLFRETGVAFAEAEFFKIFDYAWLAGNPNEVLKDPKTVVISRKIATRYYGLTEGFGSILGNVINLGNTHDLTIVGVFEDPPMNTNFPFEIIIHFFDLDGYNAYFRPNSWETTNGGTECYMLLPSELTVADLERGMPDFIDKYNASKDNSMDFKIQPLGDIHSDGTYSTSSSSGNYTGRTTSKEMIWSLSLVGLFLVVIACVNFINLSTAQALKRSKEIGIRKVLGGVRIQLMSQFLGETMIISMGSTLIALGIAEVLLMNLEEILGFRLFLGISEDGLMLAFLAVLTLMVGLLSGLYPALLLSGLNPVTALKGKILRNINVRSISIRRGLVVLQFIISQAFIMATIIVLSQMDYFQSKDLGFNKENIIMGHIPIVDSLRHQQFENLLMVDSRIEQVSFSIGAPTALTNNTSTFIYEPAGKENSFNVNVKDVDEDYLELFNLNLIAGRNLMKGDALKNTIVNEEFIRTMGLYNPQDAIGERISLYGNEFTIIGVVKDFHVYSLHERIIPMMLRYGPQSFYTAAIKFKENGETGGNDMTFLNETWSQVYPEYVPTFFYLEDQLNYYYGQEQTIADLFRVFSIIAILISCLGLYGLISFMATQKTKEIGIRKVLGASVLNILRIFSTELAYLLIVASLVAIPITYFLLDNWLTNFTYSVTIGPVIIAKGLLLTLFVALITMTYQSIKASVANPVIALKDE